MRTPLLVSLRAVVCILASLFLGTAASAQQCVPSTGVNNEVDIAVPSLSAGGSGSQTQELDKTVFYTLYWPDGNQTWPIVSGQGGEAWLQDCGGACLVYPADWAGQCWPKFNNPNATNGAWSQMVINQTVVPLINDCVDADGFAACDRKYVSGYNCRDSTYTITSSNYACATCGNICECQGICSNPEACDPFYYDCDCYGVCTGGGDTGSSGGGGGSCFYLQPGFNCFWEQGC